MGSFRDIFRKKTKIFVSYTGNKQGGGQIFGNAVVVLDKNEKVESFEDIKMMEEKILAFKNSKDDGIKEILILNFQKL